MSASRQGCGGRSKSTFPRVHREGRRRVRLVDISIIIWTIIHILTVTSVGCNTPCMNDKEVDGPDEISAVSRINDPHPA